jgi:predicted acyl esterase
MKLPIGVVSFSIFCAGLTLSFATPQRGQVAVDFRHIFDRNEVMIPMRDDVRLYTEIYTPKSAKEPLPLFKAVSEQASPADMFLGDGYRTPETSLASPLCVP